MALEGRHVPYDFEGFVERRRTLKRRIELVTAVFSRGGFGGRRLEQVFEPGIKNGIYFNILSFAPNTGDAKFKLYKN